MPDLIYLHLLNLIIELMENIKETCIVCKRTENEVPLVVMKYKGEELRICPQHIPVLIHDPQKLVGLVEGAENFTAG